MKNLMTYLKKSIYCISIGFILSACTSETPFNNDGTGVVRMNISMNSKITRGDITDEELESLLNNCVVYISDEIGLLHKWQGVANIPSQLTMKYDTYVAEAWAGDSVSASLSQKFYKGMTQFTVDANHASQTVVINCKIANVITSVNMETVQEDMMQNVVVSFSNSRASLELQGDDLYKKGYFMMPDNENEINYTVTANNVNGESFTKNGVIPDVQQGHEYRLNFRTDPSQSTTGGAFFDIVIEEYEDEVDEEIIIYGKPSFSWDDESLQVGDQLVNTDGPFTDKTLRIAAYNGGFQSLTLETTNMAEYIGNSKYDLVKVDDAGFNKLKEEHGIVVTKAEPNKDKMYVWYITFKESLLNKLPDSPTEYTMTITALDGKDKSNSMVVRIVNNAEAIENIAPVVVDQTLLSNSPMAILGTSATIPVIINNDEEYLGLRYREGSSGEWKVVDINPTRASNQTEVKLTDLTLATLYQYQLIGGEVQDGKYKFESEIFSFTTEAKFDIPYGDMESWYMNGKVPEIGLSDKGHDFWDTGNHGSASYGFTLTESNSDYKSGGTYGARLKSQFAGVFGIGKFAAGNLFAGEFGETVGTKGAKLTFGQPYNGSHPKALRVYVYYTPGEVDYSETDALQKKETDQGQIFIAIANAPSSLNTAEKIYFDPVASNILGYGEKTMTAEYGDNGNLKVLEIPITYYEKAKSNKASHIIIVCSASKYGDYFTGSSKSTMYVDDFELVY